MMIWLGSSRAALELDAHPAVAFVAALVAARDHRIGEDEERSVVAALLRRAARR